MLTINFEFVGGPNDGKVLRGSLGDASDAERYYLFTNHGNIGQRFKVASDFAVEALAQEHSKEDATHHSFLPHYYVVVERLEEDEEVLVRASYVDKEAEPRAKDLLREFKLAAVEVESSEEKIGRYLKQTATVMGQSYGPCWPADAPESQDAAELNIALHFAHVLLNEHFSVFSQAKHADETVEAIDLLGISPGQDWFLACQFTRLYNANQLQGMLQDVERLETFWLNRRLAIDACGEHIVRVAKHCENGFGLVTGLHWIPESDQPTDLLRCWTTGKPGGGSFEEFERKLNSLSAVWLAPISVKHYARQGSFCLLAAFFQIPRDLT